MIGRMPNIDILLTINCRSPFRFMNIRHHLHSGCINLALSPSSVVSHCSYHYATHQGKGKYRIFVFYYYKQKFVSFYEVVKRLQTVNQGTFACIYLFSLLQLLFSASTNIDKRYKVKVNKMKEMPLFQKSENVMTLLQLRFSIDADNSKKVQRSQKSTLPLSVKVDVHFP